MSRYILALDQGTTSSRAILFDREGQPCGIAQRPVTASYPRLGWVEQDPEEIWSSQLEVAREVMAFVGAQASDIAAIGIANQRETTIVWDRATGKAIYPAIVWQDRRTADHCERLIADGYQDLYGPATGLRLDSYFSGTKISWVLENVPGARSRAEAGNLAFGTVDCFLLNGLTGGRVHATDVTNASRTLLLDIGTQSWSTPLLEPLGIPSSLLPSVVPSSGLVAETDASLFGAPIPIGGMAGDQQAAIFGQACFRPGMAKNTYGTGCFLLRHLGPSQVASSHRLLTTLLASLSKERSQYASEGSVFVAGAVVQWLRDELGVLEKSADSEAVAVSVPDTNGVHVVPAFTGLGAPYWDPHARGAILGLTRGGTRAHIVRAALESIAYQTRDVIEAMDADFAEHPLTELRVDGGASSNNFLMQFQADILGIPVVRPQVTETTALGAAYLAGLAVGFFGSCDHIESLWKDERTFLPQMARADRDRLYAGWQEAVAKVRTQ